MPTTFLQALSCIGGRVVIVGRVEQGQPVDLDWARIQLSTIARISGTSYAYWGINSEMQTERKGEA